MVVALVSVALALAATGCDVPTNGSAPVNGVTSAAGGGPVTPTTGLGADRAAEVVRELADGLAITVTGRAPVTEAPWLALLKTGAVRRRAAVVAERMRAMGVGDLTLRTTSSSSARGSQDGGRQNGGGERNGARAVSATFSYRFTGIDVADRSFTLDLTVKDEQASTATSAGSMAGTGSASTNGTPDGSSAEVTGWSTSDRPQPWDLDGVVATRTGGSLVVAPPGELLTDLASRVAPALRAVSSVWAGSVPAVVVLPARDADAARLLGREQTAGTEASADALRDVAAVTDGPTTPGAGAGADRVVVVPGAWSGLTSAGRDVVLTHELTHVVVRRTTTGAVPLWLSEGFAELVAYRRAALPERVGVLAALGGDDGDGGDDGGHITGLPADRDFDPSTGHLPRAYARSLAVVRAAAAGPRGLDGVVRLYRAVAAGRDLDAALASELSTTRERLVTAADDRLRSLTAAGDPAASDPASTPTSTPAP